MKWSKPDSINLRFGFEVTMYVYIAKAKEQPKGVPVSNFGLKAVQSIPLAQEEKDNETV